MRNRLTVAFVVLAVLLLLGAGVVRSFVLRDIVRQQEADHLHQEASLIATVVGRERPGQVDRDLLAGLVASGQRLEYAVPGSPPVVVHGHDYEGTDDPEQDMSTTAKVR